MAETRETGGNVELAAVLSRALDELPPRLRAAIVLRSLEERGYDDMARILGVRPATARTHVMQLVDVYRARIIDVSPESLVVETTGTEDKIDSLLEVLRPYGVIEMVRTGRVAMARGIGGNDKPAPRAGHTAPAVAGDASSGSV